MRKPDKAQEKGPQWYIDGKYYVEGIYAKDDNRRKLNLTKLARQNPGKARGKWEEIKRDKPELAKLLTSPEFKELKDFFNGEVIIDV